MKEVERLKKTMEEMDRAVSGNKELTEVWERTRASVKAAFEEVEKKMEFRKA